MHKGHRHREQQGPPLVPSSRSLVASSNLQEPVLLVRSLPGWCEAPLVEPVSSRSPWQRISEVAELRKFWAMACNGEQEKRECVLLRADLVPSILEKLEERYRVFRADDDLEGSSFRDAAPFIKAFICASPGHFPRAIVESLPSLAIIANHAVGVDNIDFDYCRSRGIRVTNTPGILTDDVADLAILLMLAVLRRVCEADRFVRGGLWPQQFFPLAKTASGLRVGILGLGRIGMAIAQRAEGLDCTIAYHGRTQRPGVSYAYFPKLVDLAANSDVLVVACPLSKATKHIIGREVLDALGPEGTLINIARGSIVDERELIEALAEKRLGGAGLDVFENEPNVPSELLKMDNVVLSPHAGTATWETREAIGQLVLDNLHAFYTGKPLLTPVI